MSEDSNESTVPEIGKYVAINGDSMPFRPSYGALVLLCLNDRKIGSRDPRPKNIGLRRGFTVTQGIILSAEYTQIHRISQKALMLKKRPNQMNRGSNLPMGDI
jgi:hypothetical protein